MSLSLLISVFLLSMTMTMIAHTLTMIRLKNVALVVNWIDAVTGHLCFDACFAL